MGAIKNSMSEEDIAKMQDELTNKFDKMKEKLKELIDNFIIKHKIWFLKHWDNISIGLLISFILSAFIGTFLNSPITMCVILVFELLLLYNSIVIGSYIDDLLINKIEESYEKYKESK